MISPALPESFEWSGASSNGIAKYVPRTAYEIEDAEGYFAFKLKDGICESAVYSCILESSKEAQYFANVLNNGTWLSDMDDDDDDDNDDDFYYVSKSTSRSFKPMIFDMLKKTMRNIQVESSTRASLLLPIPVHREGNVLYMVIPNVKGLSMDELKTVMDIWCGNSTTIPDHVIFGTYKNGVYTCDNMRGMNIKYVITTASTEDNICTKYTTSITLPSEGWAQVYYQTYLEQLDGMEQQYGHRPDLSITGTTVILDAFIEGDVPMEYIESVIYSLDWLNNSPILYALF